MRPAFTSSFLASVQLAAAQSFVWRLYNNGGCDHGSPANATFPPSPAAPRTGIVDQCVTTPQGIPWNRLEASGQLDMFVFCDANCTGANLENVLIPCNSAPAGCVINSFIAFPAS
ncbi:hypothetical protein B0H13DRAFT_1891455 [Mycena leptocephala]|nr:hypothetical protein B0H13DRAFT_1891455 [Mycena leptocephala]